MTTGMAFLGAQVGPISHETVGGGTRVAGREKSGLNRLSLRQGGANG
jgi:hypothetical protein